MPVKRRSGKRRVDRAAELAAWSDMFETGFDFFGELSDFGFKDEAAAREGAKEAWHRLGADFLAQHNRDGKPWSLTKFGEPRKCP